MNSFKFALLFSGAVLGALLSGCVKNDSTVVGNDSGTGVFLTSVTQLPASISINDTFVVFTAKVSSPKAVSSVLVEISNVDGVIGDVALLDDGKTASHDAVAGDSIFTGAFTLSSDMENGSYTVTYKLTPLNAPEQVAAEQTFLYSNAKDNPPVISNFQSTIPDTIVANSDIPFTYSINATDPDGAKDIASVYMVVYQASGSVLNLSLYDDGTHGDQIANDGVYSIGLSFGAENTKGTYRFEFHAKDRLGVLSNTIIHYQTLK
jgi:hypothetical protein